MEDRDQDIHDLIAAGQKIQAIKLYRDRYGAGLKEAKDAVEALEAGHPLPSIGMFPNAAGATVDDEIDSLLRGRQKIQAVKLYRERYGGDLKAAKDAIDARSAQLGVGGGFGCAVLPLAMALLFTAACLIGGIAWR
jgi:ribosomal protein L7/L12